MGAEARHRPPSRTRIWSHERTAATRCEMVTTQVPARSRRMAQHRSASVAKSRALTASSRMRTEGRRNAVRSLGQALALAAGVVAAELLHARAEALRPEATTSAA